MSATVLVYEGGDASLPRGVLRDVDVRLAVSPTAMWEFTQAELPFVIPEEVVSLSAVEAACVAIYERARETWAALAADIASEFGSAAGRAAACGLWEIGRWLDGYVYRAMVLQALQEAHGGRFMAVAPPLRQDSELPLVLPAENRLWARVLSRMSWSASAVQWVTATPGTPPTARPRGVGTALASSPAAWSIAQSWRLGLWGNVGRLLMGSSASVMMLKAPYDWRPMLAWAETAGVRVLFEEPGRYFESERADGAAPSVFAAVARHWDTFTATLLPAASAPVRYLGITVARFVADSVRLGPVVQHHCAATVQRFDVRVVLNAIGSDARMQMVLDGYRQVGVPVLKWQHGSVWHHQRITQRMDDSDMATADVHFTYGEGSRAAYLAAGRHRHCHVEAVGSSRLEELASRPVAKPAPRTILYAATNLYDDGWYCGFSPPFTDGLYFRRHIALVQALAKIAVEENATFTIKMPSRPNFPRVWLDAMARLPRCRLVTDETSYIELLQEHSFIVIDCPTTTMLEALCTDRDLFVLHNTPAWDESDLALLRRRAVCESDPAALAVALKRSLQQGVFPAARDDRAFLERHGSRLGCVAAVQVRMAPLLASVPAVNRI